MLYPGGITEISRGLSDSDTPGSRTREKSSSSRRDDRRSGLDRAFFDGSKTASSRLPTRTLDRYPQNWGPQRLAPLRDAESCFFLIRGYRRVAPQPPANLCHPSGMKRRHPVRRGSENTHRVATAASGGGKKGIGGNLYVGLHSRSLAYPTLR